MSMEIDIQALLPNSLRSSQSSEQQSWRDQMEEDVCALLPSLSIRERLMGCLFCVTLGYLLSFGSFLRFAELLVGNPGPFVIFSTAGNILSLCSTCFLTTPSRQIKSMFHETRRVASVLFVGSLFLTLVIAFTCHDVPGQALMLILCMIGQYVAIAWYCLSYVPFGREGLKRVCARFYAEIMEE
mmetsp:Transcript_26554/g.32143  ORF Transcript_26554/g.32143 Transcript_26554/m.32143 type:complete len:184 (+) Transcript_26554:194-745(+)